MPRDAGTMPRRPSRSRWSLTAVKSGRRSGQAVQTGFLLWVRSSFRSPHLAARTKCAPRSRSSETALRAYLGFEAVVCKTIAVSGSKRETEDGIMPSSGLLSSGLLSSGLA